MNEGNKQENQSKKTIDLSPIIERVIDTIITSTRNRMIEEWHRGLMNTIDFYKPLITEILKDPKYNGLTIDDLLTPSNEEEETKYIDILSELLDECERIYEKTHNDTDAVRYTDLKVITTTFKKLKSVLYPIDPVSRGIFGEDDSFYDGLIKLIKGKIECVINFDSFDDMQDLASDERTRTTLKNLSVYDKRIYITACNLYEFGMKRFTIEHLYQAIYDREDCPQATANKIFDSLLKMRRTEVTLSNMGELKANMKYPSFSKNGVLLAWTSTDYGIYKGQITKRVIELIDEPFLLNFAKSRDQYTTVNKSILNINNAGVNVTEKSLALHDYLTTHILRMKKDARLSRELYFETIFEKCHITGRDKSRKKKTVVQFLNFFNKEGFLPGYYLTDEKKKIVFEIPTKKEKKAKSEQKRKK